MTYLYAGTNKIDEHLSTCIANPLLIIISMCWPTRFESTLGDAAIETLSKNSKCEIGRIVVEKRTILAKS